MLIMIVLCHVFEHRPVDLALTTNGHLVSHFSSQTTALDDGDAQLTAVAWTHSL